MVKDAEKRLAARCSPRRTTRASRAVGRFLRRFRIDELPQLVNILKGEMSFVGPRPERPFFVEQYVAEMPGYRERFNIKPGVTGLAQVSGGYATTPERKLKYDLIYMYHQNLAMDVADRRRDPARRAHRARSQIREQAIGESQQEPASAQRQAARKQATAQAGCRAEPAASANAGRAAPGRARRGRSRAMSLARRIAWWALLAMVFLVPVAMSNFTLPRLPDLPFTFDQFDIVKVFFQRVLGAGRARRLGVGHAAPGRQDPAHAGRLAHPRLPRLGGDHHGHLDPLADRVLRQAARFEGLLSFVNYAVIYFLVLQFADRPSRVRALAQSLFWSSVVVAGYGVLQFVGLRPGRTGARCRSRPTAPSRRTATPTSSAAS